MSSPIGVEMSVIGLKGCGKTTYLLSLLSLDSVSGEVKSTGMGKESLQYLLDNFLKKGLAVPATDMDSTNRLTYRFDIALSKKSAKRWKKPSAIELSIKDNAGEYVELVHAIRSNQKTSTYAERQENEKTVNGFFEDLFKINRWIVIISELREDVDDISSQVFEEISHRINDNINLPAIKSLRIAVVMSKCERGEVWSGRVDPEFDLFKIRLPKTYRCIKDNLADKVEFFACSAFGVLGDRDPRPNRFYIPDKDRSLEYRARLRDPNKWNPYGVLEPIYWLSTGEKLHNEFL